MFSSCNMNTFFIYLKYESKVQLHCMLRLFTVLSFLLVIFFRDFGSRKKLNKASHKQKFWGKTLYSDIPIGAITLVVSFDAPLEFRKSSTSKFVSAPAFPFTLQYPCRIGLHNRGKTKQKMDHEIYKRTYIFIEVEQRR